MGLSPKRCERGHVAPGERSIRRYYVADDGLVAPDAAELYAEFLCLLSAALLQFQFQLILIFIKNL